MSTPLTPSAMNSLRGLPDVDHYTFDSKFWTGRLKLRLQKFVN